jgi:hypothetical protein
VARGGWGWPGGGRGWLGVAGGGPGVAGGGCGLPGVAGRAFGVGGCSRNREQTHAGGAVRAGFARATASKGGVAGASNAFTRCTDGSEARRTLSAGGTAGLSADQAAPAVGSSERGEPTCTTSGSATSRSGSGPRVCLASRSSRCRLLALAGQVSSATAPSAWQLTECMAVRGRTRPECVRVPTPRGADPTGPGPQCKTVRVGTPA